MSRRNPNSKRRSRCPHCKVTLGSSKPHRKNCTVKNNETGWPTETGQVRLYDRRLQ